MGAGRPRKPDNVKILQGTYRIDRDGEPCPPVEMPGRPTKPDDLTGEASAFWDKWVPQLCDLGVAREIDGPQLSLMCRYWAESKRTHAAMAEAAIGDENYYRLSQIAVMLDKQLRGLQDKFGLNPSDRSKLRVKAPQAETNKVRTRKRA
jgi:phage terminase small subunit